MLAVPPASRSLLSVVVVVAGVVWSALAAVPQTSLAADPAAQTRPAPVAQEVVFDLVAGGVPAGSHTLTVRHIRPREGAFDETRILESYEVVGGERVAEPLQRRTRSTARADGSTLSFTSITETGPQGSGRVTEVNARRMSDGSWFVNVTRGGATETKELRRSQVDLSTLDLLDPKLHTRLVGRSHVRVLDHITGAVLEGDAEDLGEVTIQVGADTLPVRRYLLKIDGQTWQWDWNLEGMLVRYDARVGALPLTARAKQIPAARKWGAVDASTRFDNGNTVNQDEL